MISGLVGGAIPLVWAGARPGLEAVEAGDALSPVIVALCSGRRVTRAPARSDGTRMAASGTIGHLLQGGVSHVWGSGCGAADPRAARGAGLRLHATRGPHSRALMRGGSDPQDGVYGDPLWLLPRFHRTAVDRTWELGVIAHRTELEVVRPDAQVRPEWRRYAVPESLAGSVTVFDMLATDAVSAIARIERIRSCRRVVSLSLHGLIIAEAFGIPCLYFATSGARLGLTEMAAEPAQTMDAGVADFYGGLRRDRVPVFVQPRGVPTPWLAVMRAVDQAWSPGWLREDDLLAAMPVPANPVLVPAGETGLTRPDMAPLESSPEFPHPTLRTTAASVPLAAWVAQHRRVPLAWVATTPEAPFSNLGDALSALVVSTISGLPVDRRSFDDRGERLIGIGTIGHAQRRGVPHLWGTGLDSARNAFDRTLQRFAVPPDTRFVVHATRGRNTAAVLAEAGVAVRAAYGDPAWFLPRIFHRPVTITHELGVVVHITELAAATPQAAVANSFVRYAIPQSLRSAVRIINTYTPPTRAGLEDKVDEMRACRRIAATSFHGVVIAEAYGIPCVWFSPYPGGGQVLDVDDPAALLDHRIRDFYSGTPRRALPVFGAQRHLAAPWDQLLGWIDRAWSPLEISGAALLESFPLPRQVSIEDARWDADPAILDALPL